MVRWSQAARLVCHIPLLPSSVSLLGSGVVVSTASAATYKRQVRSGHVRTRSNQVSSGQDRMGQDRPGQVRSGQDRSDQVRSDQVRSRQVRSNQIRWGCIRRSRASPRSIAPLRACGATPCRASRSSDSLLSGSEELDHAEWASTGFMVASGGVLSEGYGHGGRGVCVSDGQTEAEGVSSQGGRGDALLQRMPPYLT